jgi:hypothetical protein
MDIPFSTNLMFLTRHFVHVAQGQGFVSSSPSSLAMDRLNIRSIVEKKSDNIRSSRYSRELVDHRQALMETVSED